MRTTGKFFKKTYFVAVEICCAVLIFITLLKYVVISTHHSHTQLTSLMLDESRDFKIHRTSVKSRYMFYCNHTVVDSASTIEDTFGAERPMKIKEKIVVRKLTDEYLDQLAELSEENNPKIEVIAVATSPLEGPYISSPAPLLNKARRQWTLGDYHAFIAFSTNDWNHWALDKNRSGIYVSNYIRIPDESCRTGMYTIDHDPPRTVIPYFGKLTRAAPLTMMCQAQLTDCDGSTSYPLKNLTAFLRNEIHRPYNLLYDNCQSFTKRLFNEVVKENIWDPLPPFYFLFDTGIEYFFSLVMELAIVFKSFLACTLFKSGRKHLKFVCFTLGGIRKIIITFNIQKFYMVLFVCSH